MSVRLNKALRELNIGIQTAVDFLKKHPSLGEIKGDPNFKLSDAQYEVLTKVFAKDSAINSQSLFQRKKPIGNIRNNEDNRIIHKIGLKNFRRFNNMTEISIGDINMFVGGNNGGKSTVVKGLMLVVNFLKHAPAFNSATEYPLFPFDVEGVNIDTFDRALCWDSNEKDISFDVAISDFNIVVKVRKNNIDSRNSFGDVVYVEIHNSLLGIKIVFDFTDVKANITFEDVDAEEKKLELEQCISELNKYKTRATNVKTKMEEAVGKAIEKPMKEGGKVIFDANFSAELTNEYLECNKKIEELEKKKVLLSSGTDTYEYTIPLTSTDNSNFLVGLIKNIEKWSSETSDKSLSAKERKTRKELYSFNDRLTAFEQTLDIQLDNVHVEYISSHAATQNVLFNKNDLNDYVARSINELYANKITSLSPLGSEMVGWLKRYTDKNIEDFKVVPTFAEISKGREKKSIIGEGVGYAFGVKSNGKWHDLGDMGRGTIQLIVMFARLATILKKYSGTMHQPIILIEEPEQNLHPNFQSKLADLFNDINSNHKVTFIIETHSEYIIRKSQVIVAEHKDDIPYVNPFKVYFFPPKESVYELEYRKDGKFVNEFGTGFFDEASNLAFEIF